MQKLSDNIITTILSRTRIRTFISTKTRRILTISIYPMWWVLQTREPSEKLLDSKASLEARATLSISWPKLMDSRIPSRIWTPATSTFSNISNYRAVRQLQASICQREAIQNGHLDVICQSSREPLSSVLPSNPKATLKVQLDTPSIPRVLEISSWFTKTWLNIRLLKFSKVA